ncbi:MAG TPA: phage holin family protein [Clostridia bacterium]|nr:phage holin family protein [Clostridia bacterium]HRX42481.1 phage holin family protein [Clostridia bacterium]
MIKFLIRTAIYFTVLCIFALLFEKVSGSVGLLLLGAVVLALVNILIRPLLTAIALPLNLVTLGIASIFVNILTLVIADAIVGGIVISGFWVNLLLALVIMVADGIFRRSRREIWKNHAYSV